MVDVLAGIFIGGSSRRMGQPKGLLVTEDGLRLVDRWRRVLREARVPRIVLVGEHAAYADVDLDQLPDAVPGQGPAGGLLALLGAAGSGPAIAVACDMPWPTAEDVRRLVDAPSGPAVLAPRREDRWEPLFARYDPPRCVPVLERRLARGERSLQGLLDELAAPVAVPPERLDDWDRPEDLPAPLRAQLGGRSSA
ncbi:MAG: molybdenum cofactor guanylyltransferase [Sandaracinaceae bacterium]